MSGNFDSYERELGRICDLVRERLAQARTLSGPARRQQLMDVDQLVDDADGLLRKMEAEAQVAPPAQRLQQRMRSANADLLRLRREVQSEALMGDAGGAGGAGGFGAGPGGRAFGQDARTGLLANQNQLDDTSARLLETQRVAEESAAMGTNILGDMYGQRQQLERASENLDHVEDTVTRSRKILGSMGRRVVTNNLILAIIIVVLIVAIVAIAYFAWLRALIAKVAPPPSPPPSVPPPPSPPSSPTPSAW